MTTVAAALITRDSKLLVCQRRHDDTHALQWEFPGGKVEPGESPSQALVRELREELGVEGIVGKEIFRTSHRYREFHAELNLIFFEVDVEDSALLQNLVFERFEWTNLSTLPHYNFLQADRELIGLLASRSIQLDALL
jgi:8-oxo-dGTP diphosphatase